MATPTGAAATLLPAPKYAQSDTLQLDGMLASALADGARAVVERVAGITAATELSPEVALLANAAVFGVPALLAIPTPAQRVMGLRYARVARPGKDPLASVVAPRIASVGLSLSASYLFAKVRQASRDGGWGEITDPTDPRKHTAKLVEFASLLSNVTQLVCALQFLAAHPGGPTHVSVADWLAGLTQVVVLSPPQRRGGGGSSSSTAPAADALLQRPQIFAAVAFQVVMSSLSELVATVRNLTDWSAAYATALRILSRALRRGWATLLRFVALLRWRASRMYRLLRMLSLRLGSRVGMIAAAPSRSSGEEEGEEGDREEDEEDDDEPQSAAQATRQADLTCAWCGLPQAVTPLRASCGHIYCYVCLHGALLSDRGFDCPECGESVTGARSVGEEQQEEARGRRRRRQGGRRVNA